MGPVTSKLIDINNFEDYVKQLKYPYNLYFSKDNIVKIFLEPPRDEKYVCFFYSDLELINITLFENHFPVLILFLDELRLSFSEKEKTKVLFEINLDNKQSCFAVLYRLELNKIVFSKMCHCPSKVNKEYLEYSLFQGSYAELDVSMLVNSTDFLLKVKDRNGDFPLICNYDGKVPQPPADKHINGVSKKISSAYDIPGMISSLAEEFCEKHKLNSFRLTTVSEFIELDLDPSTLVIDKDSGLIDCNYGNLISVVNSEGFYEQNQVELLIGVQTDDLGIGIPIKRLLIIGDQGPISMQECVRINAAIRYAYENKIPIDWFPASYGVKINNESGVENLDASASTAREIVLYAQDKRVPINFVVDNMNVGAQSYWNALASMCIETRGILIMTPEGSMSLTGHRALTSVIYSNLHSEDIDSVSKNLFPEGLQDLSGYKQIHGPNGEAMYFAEDLPQAILYLLTYHYFTYVKDNQGIVEKRNKTKDSKNRNILNYKHENENVVIENELNLIKNGRQANRYAVMEALRDSDSVPPIDWWQDTKELSVEFFKKMSTIQGCSTIVSIIQLDRRPVLLIFPPLGPISPFDSEIIAKAISKASGHLPVVILGNLTGYSSDPLSMRNQQLTKGASIICSIVHFRGPLIVVNLGRLVGGICVTFSKQLNPSLRMLALQGAKVQVVGGAMASKIIYHSRIREKAVQDPRLRSFSETHVTHPASNSAQYIKIFRQLINELEMEETKIFDHVHTAFRALKVGAVDKIVSPEYLREAIIDQIEDLILINNNYC